MNSQLALLHLARLLPVPFGGPTLHRAGLRALADGSPAMADQLFERAALAYRSDLELERLARVRVHQRIARLQSADGLPPDADTLVEVQHMLGRVGRIESLEPPFELVDARELLARWPGPSRERQDAAA